MKILPRYFLFLENGKKFLKVGDRSIHVQFSKLFLQIHYDFLKFNFSHFTAQVRLFFVQKRKPKIPVFKNVTEKGIREMLTFVIRQIASKIFGKIIY